MTTNLMWPEWVLRPATVTPLFAMAQTTSGGASPTGSEQIVGNSPGRNRVVMSGISVVTAEEERVWRTIALNLGGRSGVIMVPAFGRRTAPWPTIAQANHLSVGKVALTDTVLFSNGAGLYRRTIIAQAASTIAAGDVTLSIKMLQGSSLLGGQIFQAGEYAYAIKQVVSSSVVGGYQVFVVKLGLPAREAITTGDDLEFDNPRFRARLDSDDAMDLPLDMLRFGKGSVTFLEDV